MVETGGGEMKTKRSGSFCLKFGIWGILMFCWSLVLPCFVPCGPGPVYSQENTLQDNRSPKSGVKDGFYHEFSAALSRHVNSQGLVAYRALKEDRHGLDNFVASLAGLNREQFDRWSKRKKIAFWINAYNALTLRAIIDNYPIKSRLLASIRFPKNSIRQIAGVWDKLEHTVMGKRVTLNTIEHNILRQKFDEPRIHMALNCASMGCPSLGSAPFNAGNLDEQLDNQTRQFLAKPENFSIDRNKNRVYLSSIFSWFGEDFIGRFGTESTFAWLDDNERSVLNFINRYVSEDDREYLRTGTYRIKYLSYDWGLNEQQ
jgi:hypothetical protein